MHSTPSDSNRSCKIATSLSSAAPPSGVSGTVSMGTSTCVRPSSKGFVTTMILGVQHVHS